MKVHITILWITILLLSVSCMQTDLCQLSISKENSISNGDKTIEFFKLINENGMSVKVTNYAASLTDVSVPDKQGNFEHVVLGFDSLKNYLGKHPKFGATIGRFANRIRNAEFSLNGQTYHLEKNNKGHSIHGGTHGFNRQIFDADTFYTVKDTAIVIFKYRSTHQEGGFPGNLDISIAYKLTNHNEIILEYTAVTDKPTVVNFTNHSYFNLTGCKAPVLSHIYMIRADSITWVKKMGKGYDINYKLNKCSDSPELAAIVVEPISGRVLKAYTTEPGMQFYIPSSNMDYLTGHGGRIYGEYYGFCLEMQHFPNSPNIPQFPTTSLFPGNTYRQTTVYKFETLSE